MLKFSKTDEQYLLKKLRSARDSLRVIFAKHQLDFKNVRSGSIIFRFHLTNSSRTFDDLAIDKKTLDFMKELVSHEAFRSLATEQQVKVEFFCKARLENVTGECYDLISFHFFFFFFFLFSLYMEKCLRELESNDDVNCFGQK